MPISLVGVSPTASISSTRHRVLSACDVSCTIKRLLGAALAGSFFPVRVAQCQAFCAAAALYLSILSNTDVFDKFFFCFFFKWSTSAVKLNRSIDTFSLGP